MSITFQVVSDLHIDIAYPTLPDWKTMVTPTADILIVAGDVGKLENHEFYLEFMRGLCSGFKQVYIIPGNHEFYSHRYTMEYLLVRLREVCASVGNLTLLWDESVDLSKDLRLYGTVLWSYIPNGHHIMHLAIQSLGGSAGHGTWLNKEHHACLYHLEQAVDKAQKDGKQLVVMSHYAPSFKGCLAERYLTSPYRFFYASQLDDGLDKKNMCVWVYGHTHVNSDYVTDRGTRVVSNQYRGQGYVKDKVLSVPSS